MMWLVMVILLLFGGFMAGCIWSEWDNRRWAKRYGWCPECARDLPKVDQP